MAPPATGKTAGHQAKVPLKSVHRQNLEVPTTLELIKAVLEQYPDNGQILKELVQNADDAGASTVRFLIDENEHSAKSVIFPELAKYQGPALLAYNDAVFTEKDWGGLLDLFKSNKCEDPLKVGKFGLGFKSSFHITDVISCISCNVLAFLDPAEDIFPDEKNSGCKAYSHSPLIKDVYESGYLDQLTPFQNDIFGFGQEEMKNGWYDGTLFRFPLRQTNHNSKIHTNDSYSVDKIMGLIESMRTDGHLYLLFLKNIEKIELYHRAAGAEDPTCVYSVNISPEQLGDIRKQRKNFYSALNQNLDCTEPVTCSYKIAFDIAQGPQQTSKEEYLVQLQYHVASGNVTRLMTSTKQLPLVGVALPLSQSPPEQELLPPGSGHLFCFLPLPMEGHALTGLGVHVNGAFAVTSNRKNIKLPTVEDSRAEYERDILWNKALIEEVIPGCLVNLAKSAASLWLNQRIQEIQAMRIFPLKKHLVSLWQNLRSPFHRLVKNEPVLVAGPSSEKMKLLLRKVYFISESDTLAQPKFKVLHQSAAKAIKIREEVILDLMDAALINSIQDTDSRVIESLKALGAKLSLSVEEKSDLLKWMLSSKPSELLNMALVPLKNGQWKVWCGTEHEKFYLTNSNEEEHLLPRMNSYLIDMTFIPRESWKTSIPSSGLLNVTWFDDKVLEAKLREMSPEDLDENRLRLIWKYILPQPLDNFKKAPILKTDKGILPLDPEALVFYQPDEPYTNIVLNVLERLGATIVTKIPNFITRHPDAQNYYASPSTLHKLMNRVPASNLLACQLNDQERKEFRDLLVSRLDIVKAMTKSLKKLPLFETVPVTQEGSSALKLTSGIRFPWQAEIQITSPVLNLKDGAAWALAQGFDVKKFTRVKFLTTYAFPVAQRAEHYELILKYCLSNHDLFGHNDIRQRLSQLPCLLGEDGVYRKPSEFLDPSDPTNISLFAGHFPNMLPSMSLKLTPDNIRCLIGIGLRTSDSITTAEIKELANLIARRADASLSVSLMKFLLKNLKDPDYADIFKIRWIVADQNRPREYPACLSWLGESRHFGSLKDFVNSDEINLCGSQYLVMTQFQHAFDSPSRTSLLDHFKEILDALHEDPELELQMAYTKQLHKLLKNSDNFSDEMGQMDCAEWVFVNNSKLVTPRQIVINPLEESLEPCFYKMPDYLHFAAPFLEECGAYREISQEDLVIVVEEMYERYDKQPLTTYDLELVMSILRRLYKLKKGKKAFEFFNKMHLPNKNAVLTPVCRLAIDNCPWLADENETDHCHADISISQAQYFGVEKTRDVLIKNNSRGFGIPFGQKEKLTNRLNRLLEGYTRASILKELLQNADDAGATQLDFVLDERSHCSKSVFDEKWSVLQGPALLVHNNRPFTEADLEGISRLGEGNKQDDPMKTGQYGVGFNCVYNLTETPTFITSVVGRGRVLVAFDPHCKYVYGAEPEEPGRQFEVEGIQSKFPDVFQPYEEDIFGKKGTVFRLPLRTPMQAAESKICNTSASCEDVLGLLKTFYENDAEESLLFLRNVKRVTFSTISSSGKQDIGHVNLEVVSNVDKIAKYICLRDEDNRKVKSGEARLTDINYKNECYTAHTTKSTSLCKKVWHISLAHGFKGQISQRRDKIAAEYHRKAIRLNMNVGVAWSPALPIEAGKLFCLLPFSPSNFSFHINAHFALSHEARENLCDPLKNDVGSSWNEEILTSIVAPAHASLLRHIKRENVQASKLDQFITSYYSLFPVKQYNSTLNAFVDEVYRYVIRENRVFPKVLPALEDQFSIQWISLSKAVFDFHKFWRFPKTEARSRTSLLDPVVQDPIRHNKTILLECLLDLGMNIVCPSSRIKSELSRLKISFTELNQTSLLCFLRDHGLSTTLPCPLSSTPIKTKERLEQLCELGLTNQCAARTVNGLPLLLSQSGVLHCIGQAQLLCSTYWNVVNCPEKFVDESFIEYFSSFCKSFTIHDLKENLDTVLDPSIYEKANEIECLKIPSEIEQIWKALPALLAGKNSEQVQSVFAEWSIFPCQDRDKKLLLIPVKSSRKCVDDRNTRQSSTARQSNSAVGSILRSCCRLLPYGNQSHDSVYTNLLARPSDPHDVLNILLEAKKSFRPLISEKRDDILNFFKLELNSFKLNRKNYGREIYDQSILKLRHLPLFATVDGSVVSLDNAETFYVDRDIPAFRTGNQTQIILAYSGDTVQRKLLEALQAKCLRAVDVYERFVLRDFDTFSKEDQLSHVEWLRNLNKSDIQQIELLLKESRIVNSKVANAYHDGSSELLCKLKPDEDLPQEYAEYRNFLLKCGLRSSPSASELVTLATMLAKNPALANNNNCLYFKVLVQCVSQNNSGLLRQIADIPFLPQMNTELKTMLGKSDSSLLALKDSTICKESEAALCWTTDKIVDQTLIPREIHRSLGGCKLGSAIPLSTVVEHLKKISSQLKDINPTENLIQAYREELVSVFSWVNKKLNTAVSQEELNCLSQLRSVPLLIHKDDEGLSLLPSELFSTENVPLEVPKLLMSKTSLHDDLQSFSSVLQKIGALGKVSVKDYVNLLNRFPEDEAVAHPADQSEIVRPVYHYIIEQFCKQNDEDMMMFTHVLLPDTKLCMRRSTSLVYVDDESLFERVNADEMDLLERPTTLLRQMKAVVGSLPAHLKPKMLTSLYREDIVKNLSEAVNHYSGFKESLDRQYLDEDFGTALMKLCHADANLFNAVTTPPEVRERIQKALNLEIKIVHGLKTRLYKDDVYIDNSERAKSFYIQRSKVASMTHLYIDVIEESNRSVQDRIRAQLQVLLADQLELRDETLKNILYEITIMPLEDIVEFMGSKQLKMFECDAYDLPGKLGSKLPGCTKRKLSTAIADIDDGEYVCVMEGEAMILAQVVRLQARSRRHRTLDNYLVDFGSEQREVPLHRIYLFHRSQLKDSTHNSPVDELKELTTLMNNSTGLVPASQLSAFLFRLARRIEELQNNLKPNEKLLADAKIQVDLAVVDRKTRTKRHSESWKYHGVFNLTPNTRTVSATPNLPPSTFLPSLPSTFLPLPSSIDQPSKKAILETSYEPIAYVRSKRPNLKMAKAMLVQAKHDLNSVSNDLHGKFESLCWAAHKIHQATEKLLKAKLYTVDEIGDDLRHTHNLNSLAHAAEFGIKRIGIISSNLGELASLRYPLTPESLPKEKFISCPDVVIQSYESARELLNEFEKLEGLE